MDRLIQEASKEVVARHPDKHDSARQRMAEQIAIGALRYFLLRYTSTTIIAFDFHDALSFEGETGPYVQYAAVRSRNIFRKLEEEGGRFDETSVTPAVLQRYLPGPEGDSFWDVLYQGSRLDAVIESAIAGSEPAGVAKYAFQLAQAFNNFYHRFHILTEPDLEKKAFLLWLVAIIEQRLVVTLGLLGIEVPEAM
jgi:arginyl-tRNA synthetase